MKQTRFLFVCALLTFSMMFVACGGDSDESSTSTTETSSEKEQVKIPGSADEDSKKDPVPAATKKDDDHDDDDHEQSYSFHRLGEECGDHDSRGFSQAWEVYPSQSLSITANPYHGRS